jgi:PKD repeat protein
MILRRSTRRAHGAEHMVRAFRALTLLLTVAALAAGCSVKKTAEATLSGPSELGLSLAVSATPDILTEDGTSQSQVIIVARDTAGKAVSNVTFRLDVTVSGTIVDYGTLAAKTIVTGSDGRASTTYTAPKVASVATDSGLTVALLATPVGSNYANSVARSVDIRLVPPGTIIAPSDLVAGFTMSPESPTALTNVVFTAVPCSTSVTSNCSDGSIASYSWSFGDGGTGSGQTAVHQFDAGTWPVTLTVTDSAGRAVSTTRTITVTAGAAPTAAFVTSPASPTTTTTVFFDASQSMPATGRTIVDYYWQFGDTQTAHGLTATYKYEIAGTYNATLTVTDDAGRQGVSTKSITVTQAVATIR